MTCFPRCQSRVACAQQVVPVPCSMCSAGRASVHTVSKAPCCVTANTRLSLFIQSPVVFRKDSFQEDRGERSRVSQHITKTPSPISSEAFRPLVLSRCVWVCVSAYTSACALFNPS